MKFKKKFIKVLKSPLGKIILEALRWGVLAFVSMVVTKLLVLIPSIEATPSIEVLTIALRFIDAALHKSGWALKGITRF